ncbi:hypothetical protein [Runella slithyformis]|uniref:hypothetical protein n=1 Tax=Runella slithyformis TaxID=106 RepID=UPI0003005636|nr:hypothetical protein [Runella slithyformis]
MSFVAVELEKFKSVQNECETDLEKLTFTKKFYTITEAIQFPKFWDEDWLNIAIQELDTKAKIEEVKAADSLAIKTESVEQILLSGQLSDADSAKFSLTSMDFVKSVKQKISADKKFDTYC